jgi:hypothetical protein
VFKLFMNKKLTSQLDLQLTNLSRIPQQQILDNYRLAFIHLSGMEVNQGLWDKIDRFSTFIKEQTKVMSTFKLSVEYALVYQLGMNQRLSKFYKLMGGLEALFVEGF